MKIINDFITIMNSNEALGEIANLDIESTEKELYSKTITKFVDSSFIKYTKFKKNFPEWLKNRLGKFYFFGPTGVPLWFKFKNVITEAFSGQEIPLYSWYHFSYDVGEYNSIKCENKKLIVLAYAYDQMESVLVLFGDDKSDQKIYEINYENINYKGEAYDQGYIERENLYLKFNSIGELLSNIDLIRYTVDTIDGKTRKEMGTADYMTAIAQGKKPETREFIVKAK